MGARSACGGPLGGILSRQKMSPGKLWGGCAACFVVCRKGERFGVGDFERALGALVEGGREGWAWLMVREDLIGSRWMMKMIWSIRHCNRCRRKAGGRCKEDVNATNLARFADPR